MFGRIRIREFWWILRISKSFRIRSNYSDTNLLNLLNKFSLIYIQILKTSYLKIKYGLLESVKNCQKEFCEKAHCDIWAWILCIYLYLHFLYFSNMWNNLNCNILNLHSTSSRIRKFKIYKFGIRFDLK